MDTIHLQTARQLQLQNDRLLSNDIVMSSWVPLSSDSPSSVFVTVGCHKLSSLATLGSRFNFFQLPFSFSLSSPLCPHPPTLSLLWKDIQVVIIKKELRHSPLCVTSTTSSIGHIAMIMRDKRGGSPPHCHRQTTTLSPEYGRRLELSCWLAGQLND